MISLFCEYLHKSMRLKKEDRNYQRVLTIDAKLEKNSSSDTSLITFRGNGDQ